MTDDLTVVGVDGIRRSFHKHYDVIDEVMRDPQGALYAIQRQADRIEELEAKLAKAVEALTDIVKDCEAEYPPSHGAIKYFCRTTLAELKGEADD
jgi:hypothetical protein